STSERKTTRLQALIKRPEPLIVPGGFSPYLARIAQEAGFEAFFLAGSQTAGFLYGLPDVGIIALRDMVDHARHMAARCDIPIFADADTGYGNAVGVHFTVQEYIRAGVAGIHIEDQEAPKRSGIFAGRRCISTEEAIGKYKAAVAAKQELDADFVICARCDVIGAEGGTFDEAVRRAIAYVEEAHVDMVWMNSMHTRDEIGDVCRRIPGPVMTSYYGEPPTPNLEEWRSMGVAAAIFPACAAGAAGQAAWEFLHELKQHGPAALDAWRTAAQASRWGMVKQSALLGEPAVRELEGRFLPPENQRDYEGTFGHGSHSG
ncbi:MAG TPA: isocitrate lyase/PEP mutase family protein, partial [Chloroflexota bacterium]|nr:isocitrate lyase/PEP mutase family protein [Chloroflexota bacterium]